MVCSKQLTRQPAFMIISLVGVAAFVLLEHSFGGFTNIGHAGAVMVLFFS